MSQRMKIASLEDDLDQAQHIQQVLSAAGYTCTSYPRSLDLLAALRVQAFDLILLDWQLPDMNGDEVVRRLRTSYGFAVPIIFLTSRDQESDLVQGLQAGADDYIVKPMRPAELLARVAALLRRSQGALPDYLPFSVAGYRIDPNERSIALDGQVVPLPPKEFELAQLFFRNVGRLISRDVLAESVWNREIPATSRTLDTHLSNIRQKLQLRPQNGVRLSSSYALGYRLELVSDPQPQGDDAKDD
ncbi:response regulator transcription factor [Bordetella pertussis]|uniref:Probable two-component response regulator n=1 Tax=Bordetella pertussis (strain ATCC 9797 / DSM 5571 / CCUG 30873 / LMG 14455 / NCTC 10739 / 18323) TaxID=568706 RepID=A0A0U1RMM2_BORP1|nr:response regulator transcription factor [Bordetella pertussis]PNO99396.1 DNA-binding response regulator [Bordetella pertussis 18323]UEB56950.1 response regulator transcription factor [Bordetella pertussis]CCJ61445.1 probable two-component response regulator [Bordetella pertussis 18323]